MNFGPECKTRVSAANSSFWSKVKISQISPNIFPTFYQFPGRFSLTLQHIKNLDRPFSVSANYHRFRLLTWSKIKNFDSFYNMPFNSFSKRILLDFMFLVKIFWGQFDLFLPWTKSLNWLLRPSFYTQVQISRVW